MRANKRRAAQIFAAMASGVFTLSAAGAAAAEGKSKLADCRIESEGKVQVNGKCRFTPDAGGSFSLEHADPKRTIFFGEIMSVTVSVISPGVAEVRGLTRHGINSRWGEAKRSASDRACWQSSDFKICAR